jgi:DNA-binding ferritin-like protein (Dps family)
VIENFLKKILGDKKEWRTMEARAKALPRDYQIVYDEIKKYMFRFAGGDGMDMVDLLRDLIGLFETSAADGKRALEVTGDDVAAFCDELLRNAHTYTEDWHHKTNENVHKRLAREDSDQ